MILYKYRSLEKFERVVDALLFNRMFAAPFLDLNDPMEGRYVYPSSKSRGKTIIKRLKVNADYRVLSLSRTPANTLMWSHYASQHTGVAIGVELESGVEAKKVKYVKDLTRVGLALKGHRRAIRLLTRKHEFWKYEKEYRVILKNKTFVSVKPIELKLGVQIPAHTEEMIRELVDKICPNVTVDRIRKRDLDVVG